MSGPYDVPQQQALVAEQSDHNIELNQPDAAVAAIIRMVEQLRR